MNSSAKAARTALEVEIVHDHDGLRALLRDWTALESCAAPSFFQSWAWCEHVARMRSLTCGEHAVWIGVVRGRDRGVAGVWPLGVRRQLGARIAGPLDYPFGQFTTILSSPEAGAADVVEAVVGKLVETKSADAIILDCVPEEGSSQTALLRAGFRRTSANLAVAVDLAPFKTMGDYEATINPQSRKSLRTARNRLARDFGEVRNVVLTGRAEIAAAIEQTFAMRANWLTVNGKTSPAFRDRDFRPMLLALAEAEGIELIGFRLEAGGKTLSVHWGFMHQGRYYAYMSARDPHFDRYSPGKLHLGYIIGECHRRGLHTVELMAPTAPYKETWGTRMVPLCGFERALTVTGTLALEGTRMASRVQRWGSRVLPLAAKQRLSARLSGWERPELK